MAFDVENASLGELEAEFNRLADGRTDHFDAFKDARAALEAKLTEFQEIYGKVEVIDAITKDLLGDEPVTDGSPGNNPYSSDALDALDDTLAIGGAIGGVGSLLKLGWDIRRANSTARGLNTGAQAADNAADAVARGVVRWPKVKLLGGLAGVAASGLGVALILRDRRERETFYRTNIPVYEEWAADLQKQVDNFNDSTEKLEADLTDLQESLGYASRAEMKRELGRAMGDVSEFRAQYKSMTKMLCSGISVTDVTNYTSFPTVFVQRRLDEIVADSSICTAVA